MHSLTFLPFLTAGVIASLGATSDNYRDYEWSYHPDPTADEYLDHGSKVPSVAAAVTKVVEESSYVVKLDCLGCPFRVRALEGEYFMGEPDNSLLLNFTIGEDRHSLELNNKRILPLEIPTKVFAFQTPANLTSDVLGLMVNMQMLDESFNVGTKYGRFELSYEHIATLAEPRVEVLRFDVTNIDITSSTNPGTYELSKAGQKAVEIKISQDSWEEGLKIQSVELVDRDQAIPHGKMACGKDAPISDVKFRSTEWDYYGQQGTFARSFWVVWDESLEFFIGSIPLMVVLTTFAGALALVRRRQLMQMELAKTQNEFYMVDEEEGLLEEVDEEKEGEFNVKHSDV